jgi:hypothetical protein
VKPVGRILKRRLAALALMLGLLAGGAVVAMAASGSGGGASGQPPTAAIHRHRSAPLLQTASGYLGISRSALQSKLRSGETLSQIATTTGKSLAGLQQALGQVASAKLETRASAARTSPAGRQKHRRHNSLRDAAASYLGLTPAALSAQLRAGKTLAQVADASPGHSAQGLIDALLAARQKAVKHGAARTNAAHGSEAERLAKLRRRITTLVNKAHAAKRPHGQPHA